MCLYTCHYCKYVTQKKYNMIIHLLRIVPCCSENKGKYTYFKDLDIYICKGCKKEFELEENIELHINNLCKYYIELDNKKNIIEYNNKKEEIEIIKRELNNKNIELDNKSKELELKENELKKIETTIKDNHNINNATNESYNVNMTNNINGNGNIVNQNYIIVEFGKEDPKKLSKQDEKDIMKSCLGSIVTCVEKMHFNPNIPEHYNMFMTNMRTDYAHKYENGKFNVTSLIGLIDELIRNRAENVRDILERIDGMNFPEKTKIRLKEKISSLLRNVADYDTKTINTIKKELVYMLYNNKEKVLNNEKRIKQQEQQSQQKTIGNIDFNKQLTAFVQNDPQLLQRFLEFCQQNK